MKISPSHGSDVARRAHDVIAQHPHFRRFADRFEFEWQGDQLVIQGRVPSFYLKQLLQDALKRLEGVQRIDNRVAVVACDGISSVGS